MNARALFLKLVLLGVTEFCTAQRTEPLFSAWSIKSAGFSFSNWTITSGHQHQFMMGKRAVHMPHRRTRSATPRKYIYDKDCCLTHEEETLVLQIHNAYRSIQNSSNMRIMEWNYDLERHAQNYADKCVYEHSTQSYRKNVGGFKNVGENLFVQNHKFQITLPVKLWYDEIVDYNYRTTRCTPNKMCGHYTQVVWHHSFALGCGFRYCKNLKGARRIPKGFYVVCHYGPAGNYYFRNPFKKGEPCTDCSKKELPFCIKNMCSTRPMIGSSVQSQFPGSGVVTLLLASLTTIVAILK